MSYQEETASKANPLDPQNPPLCEQSLHINNRARVFGAFSDAGPDNWVPAKHNLINNDQAREEADKLADALSHWRSHFKNHGVTDQDIKIIEHVCKL